MIPEVLAGEHSEMEKESRKKNRGIVQLTILVNESGEILKENINLRFHFVMVSKTSTHQQHFEEIVGDQRGQDAVHGLNADPEETVPGLTQSVSYREGERVRRDIVLG